MFGPIIVKTEVYVGGRWTEKSFREIKKGDIFRTYKQDGITISSDSRGYKSFIAKEDVSVSADGFNTTVVCDPYEV